MAPLNVTDCVPVPLTVIVPPESASGPLNVAEPPLVTVSDALAVIESLTTIDAGLVGVRVSVLLAGSVIVADPAEAPRVNEVPAVLLALVIRGADVVKTRLALTACGTVTPDVTEITPTPAPLLSAAKLSVSPAVVPTV